MWPAAAAAGRRGPPLPGPMRTEPSDFLVAPPGPIADIHAEIAAGPGEDWSGTRYRPHGHIRCDRRNAKRDQRRGSK